MPKVRMATIGAGPAGTWRPGDEVEVSDELAAQLTAGGYGTVVDPPSEDAPPEAAPPEAAGVSVPQTSETAALAGGETAARTEAPKPRQRRRAPEPSVAADDLAAVALMGLTNAKLGELIMEHGVTGLPRKPNKAQLVAALRAAGVSVPQTSETAALAGGETAARTEAPKPRRRRRAEG